MLSDCLLHTSYYSPVTPPRLRTPYADSLHILARRRQAYIEDLHKEYKDRTIAPGCAYTPQHPRRGHSAIPDEFKWLEDKRRVLR